MRPTNFWSSAHALFFVICDFKPKHALVYQKILTSKTSTFKNVITRAKFNGKARMRFFL